MKYKIGDRVRIKSLDWYNRNKNSDGRIRCGKESFVEDMSEYCGRIATITETFNKYRIDIDDGFWCWIDDMFEDVTISDIVAKSEYPITPVEAALPSQSYKILSPQSYKIIFGADSPNETELVLGDNFEMKEENGVFKVVRKEKKYPKTYNQCCDVLGLDTMDNDAQGYKWEYIIRFQELLIARDAYWKIAGEEMGLGKSWEPDWSDGSIKYVMLCEHNEICVDAINCSANRIIAFPTEEMRDTFYENFKNEIEQCKELL